MKCTTVIPILFALSFLSLDAKPSKGIREINPDNLHIIYDYITWRNLDRVVVIDNLQEGIHIFHMVPNYFHFVPILFPSHSYSVSILFPFRFRSASIAIPFCSYSTSISFRLVSSSFSFSFRIVSFWFCFDSVLVQ